VQSPKDMVLETPHWTVPVWESFFASYETASAQSGNLLRLGNLMIAVRFGVSSQMLASMGGRKVESRYRDIPVTAKPTSKRPRRLYGRCEVATGPSESSAVPASSHGSA
jgi:hypothetical protein